MENVKQRLTTLPDKLTHPIQVPVGIQTPASPPLVLLNGQLKHTNEILVLLGDNWFVERSVKQSLDILDRRIEKTKAMIENFRKEQAGHQQWIEAVEQMRREEGRGVELVEKFDEEEEKRWREAHRAKVRAEKARERAERVSSAPKSDREVMNRLEELQLQEEQASTPTDAAAAPASSTAFTGVVTERSSAAISHPHSPLDNKNNDKRSGKSKFAASRSKK